MPKYLTEHYLINHQPIILVMTQQRRALQAWVANLDEGKMQRQDTLIMDVLQDDVERISPQHFDLLCRKNHIDAIIPERGIALSFRLAASSQNQQTNIIPSPAPHALAQ